MRPAARLLGSAMLALGVALAMVPSINAHRSSASVDTGFSVPAEYAAKVAHDVRLRKLLGLRVDLRYVSSLYEELATGELRTDRAFDMALSAEEYAEMVRRTGLNSQLPAVRHFFAARPEVFGGVFIDQPGDGALVIQVTRDADRYYATLGQIMARGSRFRVELVKSSQQRLQAVQRQISTHRDLLKANGATVHGLGIDDRRNAVRIFASGDLAAVRRMVEARYPDVRFVVELGEAPRPEGVTAADPPFRGGIENVDLTDRYGCSNGFTGYRNTVPTSYYMLTAGHCGATGDEFGQNVLTQTAGTYGYMGHLERRAFAPNVLADAARIRIPATHKANYIVIGPYQYRTIKSSAPQGSVVRGTYVCISTTNYVDTDGDKYNCGTVQDSSYDYSLVDRFGVSFSTSYGRLANYGSTAGDSGSPVVSPYEFQAFGIHSAGGSNGKVFGHIYDALRGTDTHGIWPG